uniref:Uncharacterized protein n=1 Tax=Anguilla anguilla TaxID=7936 RepID=A0A0E9XWC1_ANGAN
MGMCAGIYTALGAVKLVAYLHFAEVHW